MPNLGRRIVSKSRDALLKNITDHMHQADERLFNKLDAMEEALRRTDFELARDTVDQIVESRLRTMNSGTIALSETEIITKIFSGLKMYLDPRDLAITPHLALDGIWEPDITKAWLKVLGKTDTVLDIGANNGYYGALSAQHTDKKRSKVFMFEANPGLIPYIKKTLAVNWLNEQTQLENLAVGAKKGELKLTVLKDYIGSSSVHDLADVEKYMHDKMHLETQEVVTVKSVSIDEYCQEHGVAAVDQIVMDIEGYEDVAYVGMKKTIKQSPRATLFIEFTKDGYKDAKAFYEEMLADFGNVYTIGENGVISKPKNSSYAAVVGDTDDWVMPIFSKRTDLHQI